MTAEVEIEVARVGDLPQTVLRRLRALSLGPDQEWGSWSWFFSTGRVWAAVAVKPGEGVVGWCALNFELDVLPVIGVFVDPDHRSGNLAHELVERLLEVLGALGELDDVRGFFASTERFPEYDELMTSHGFRCLTWQ